MAGGLTYEQVKHQLGEIQNFKRIQDGSLIVTVLGDGRLQKIQYTIDKMASVDNAKAEGLKERRGKYYEVGPTRVTITFLSNKLNSKKTIGAAVRFRKANPKQIGPLHPNVFGGGGACWHGMVQMQQAWKDKDITQLVYGTLIFLSSLDSTDTATHGFEYKDISKKKLELLKGF